MEKELMKVDFLKFNDKLIRLHGELESKFQEALGIGRYKGLSLKELVKTQPDYCFNYLLHRYTPQCDRHKKVISTIVDYFKYRYRFERHYPDPLPKPHGSLSSKIKQMRNPQKKLELHLGIATVLDKKIVPLGSIKPKQFILPFMEARVMGKFIRLLFVRLLIEKTLEVRPMQINSLKITSDLPESPIYIDYSVEDSGFPEIRTMFREKSFKFCHHPSRVGKCDIWRPNHPDNVEKSTKDDNRHHSDSSDSSDGDRGGEDEWVECKVSIKNVRFLSDKGGKFSKNETIKNFLIEIKTKSSIYYSRNDPHLSSFIQDTFIQKQLFEASFYICPIFDIDIKDCWRKFKNAKEWKTEDILPELYIVSILDFQKPPLGKSIQKAHFEQYKKLSQKIGKEYLPYLESVIWSEKLLDLKSLSFNQRYKIESKDKKFMTNGNIDLILDDRLIHIRFGKDIGTMNQTLESYGSLGLYLDNNSFKKMGLECWNFRLGKKVIFDTNEIDPFSIIRWNKFLLDGKIRLEDNYWKEVQATRIYEYNSYLHHNRDVEKAIHYRGFDYNLSHFTEELAVLVAEFSKESYKKTVYFLPLYDYEHKPLLYFPNDTTHAPIFTSDMFSPTWFHKRLLSLKSCSGGSECIMRVYHSQDLYKMAISSKEKNSPSVVSYHEMLFQLDGLEDLKRVDESEELDLYFGEWCILHKPDPFSLSPHIPSTIKYGEISRNRIIYEKWEKQ